jgi:L-threonylcarbamoyladenylate synthase
MDAVADAIAAIRGGRPVILPTDTVYGLCTTPDREDAVRGLARLKGRDEGRPIALLAGGLEALLECLPELRGRAEAIARALLPGPYTLVLPNPARRYAWLTGPRPDAIGVRVPDLVGAAARVLASVGAVAATSANPSGGPDPARLVDVPEELQRACAAVVDAGRLPGTASTVIDFTGTEPQVLREGAAPGAHAIGRALAALAATS